MIPIVILVIKIKEILKEFNQGNDNDFENNEDINLVNWRLFEIMHEKLEVYPALSFWEETFKKFNLIFQNEKLLHLNIQNSKDIIIFLSQKISKNIILEEIKFTYNEEK